MAAITVTVATADEAAVLAYFQEQFPDDGISVIADIQPCLVRWVKGKCHSSELRQNGESAEASYTDPDIT